MLTGEFRAACEQLQPLIELARNLSPQIAANRLALHHRHESIFLMPRAGGKTEIGISSVFGHDGAIQEEGGWLDENQSISDSELARLITAMLKLKREQRSTLPKYNPKIFLRPETWDRISPRFHWLHPHNIAQIQFPAFVFYDSLREAGASPDALAHFPMSWLEYSCDSSRRLLPGLAYSALKRTVQLHLKGVSATQSIWRGYAEAAAEFVQAQTDVNYWLAYMAAGDRQMILRMAKFTLPRERALLRIRQARIANPEEHLPHELSAPQFLRYCELAGIWQRTSRDYLAFSTPYSVGTHFLKASLTDAAFKRMLRA